MTDLTKNKEQKQNVKTLIGFAAGISAYLLVQYFFFSPLSFDKTLMNVASEINKTCPIMVDQETRLDNVAALPGNVFQYNYTLIQLTSNDIDINELTNLIKPRLINNIKTNPDLKTFRDNDVTMSYLYSDKKGKFITKISIMPDEYADGNSL